MLKPRILIVEDHPLMADALRVQLQRHLPEVVCVQANSLQQGLLCLQAQGPFAMVLLDLNLPDSKGMATLDAFCASRSVGPMVVLTALDDEHLAQSCLANQVLFLSKSVSSAHLMAELLAALSDALSCTPSHAAHEPEPDSIHQLSKRQRLVLAMLAQGKSRAEIAAELAISENTVRTHMSDIYQRLGVQNRTQASTRYVLWTQQHGAAHD
jgi:DNA-binding NarL/FixJ family response regulator